MNKEKQIKKTTNSSIATNLDKNNGNLKRNLTWLIFVFAFILYAQSISFDYTLDDGSVIKENVVTKQGIKAIPTIFKHSYWYGINDTRVAEYRPTSLAMFAVEWQLFPGNPAVNHFMNVLLFAITCGLLFLLLADLFSNNKESKNTQNLIVPFLCSLLFVAHPIHTEVVDSIKSRDEILCFLFSLVAAYCFLKSLADNSILKIILGSISFFLAMASKETSISFLIIMPLMFYVFTDAKWKQILKVFIILLAMTGLYFFIRSLALRTITQTLDASPFNNTLYAATDFVSQKATAFYILLKYILLLILPHPLSYDYSFSHFPILKITDPMALLSILVYAGIGIYAFLHIRKKNIVAFAILFYLVSLAPVSNIFIMIGATMAERFMYMPSLGFCLAVSFLIVKLIKNKAPQQKINNLKQLFSANSTALMIVVVIAGLYSVKTLARSQDWKDNPTLYAHDIEVVPNSARANINLGISLLKDVYTKERNDAAKPAIVAKAIPYLKRGYEIYPESGDCFDALGQAFFALKDYPNAILYFEKLFKEYPPKSADDYKLASVCYDETKQYEKELAVLDSVLKFEPKEVESYIKKGRAYGYLGKDSLSIQSFRKAIEINPNSKTAYKDMGISYAFKNRLNEALDCLNKALKIDSLDAETYGFIGKIYQAGGDQAKAKQFFDKSAALEHR